MGVINGATFQAELSGDEREAWTVFFSSLDLRLNQIRDFEVKENGDVEIHVLHENENGRHLEGHCDLGEDILFLRTMRDEDGNITHPPCSCGKEPSSDPDDEFTDPYSHDPCTNTIVVKAPG